MFFNAKALVLSVLSASALVAANPVEKRTDSGQCNVGQAYCCNAVYQNSNPLFQLLTGALGITIPVDNTLSGFQCSPILNTLDIITGSDSCNASPVCCSGNTYNGLVNVGCSPITV